MVCPSCKRQECSACPEIVRRIRLRADPALMPALKVLHSHSGQVCDCQHGTDSFKLNI